MWQVGGFQDGRDWKYLVTQARQLPRNAKSYTYIQDGNAGTQTKVGWQIQMGISVCLYKGDKLTDGDKTGIMQVCNYATKQQCTNAIMHLGMGGVSCVKGIKYAAINHKSAHKHFCSGFRFYCLHMKHAIHGSHILFHKWFHVAPLQNSITDDQIVLGSCIYWPQWHIPKFKFYKEGKVAKV